MLASWRKHVFKSFPRLLPPDIPLVRAEPLTGRTHQIRVHAAAKGFPILGDTLYGGPAAPRVCLHATEITFQHPDSGKAVTFNAPADFESDPRLRLRTALIEPEETSAFRLLHGASDGWPGWHVDLLGEWLVSQSASALNDEQLAHLAQLPASLRARGVYHKHLTRALRRTALPEASPGKLLGEAAPDRFSVRENGITYELSFNEGYSVGLFLDQRDNRRRLLTRHIAADFPLTPNSRGAFEVLNTFAYTCAFSVCAARAGARVTSLDLSKKYLEWGRRNFALNQIDPASHDFIFGDVFDWLKRLAKKERRYDLILLDPPTFSQSKQHGVFRAQKHYGRLVQAALPLLKNGGVLFASSNAADWPPEEFVATIEDSLRQAGRSIVQRHYAPQPPDFPVSRAEPAYLKTLWLRLT